jgi:hypothetical protein
MSVCAPRWARFPALLENTMDEHSAEASSVASLAAASASGSLPPLPLPGASLEGLDDCASWPLPYFTADQMRLYAAAVLEEAAKVCEEVAAQQERDHGAADTGGASACVASIRALKP